MKTKDAVSQFSTRAKNNSAVTEEEIAQEVVMEKHVIC